MNNVSVGLTARRVKLVHVDLDIHKDHPDIDGRFKFYIDGDEEAADARSIDYERALQMLHGASCLAVLTRSGELTGPDEQFWNLADFADIYSLPVRAPEAPPCELYPELSIAQATYFSDVASVVGTLDALLHEKSEKALQKGDVVAITFGLDDVSPSKQRQSGLFPIIHNPIIAERVRRITTELEVSVVVSAGNAGQNLDFAHMSKQGCINPATPRHYQNHGVPCGAVIVGASQDGRRGPTTNYGSCVDAYAPGSIFEMVEGKRQKLVGVEPDALGQDDLGRFIDMNGRVLHWADTSSATMYVAALLANLQQFRLCRGFAPVQPYAARAHLRQWQALDPSAPTSTIRLPDIISWLVGTGVITEESLLRL